MFINCPGSKEFSVYIQSLACMPTKLKQTRNPSRRRPEDMVVLWVGEYVGQKWLLLNKQKQTANPTVLACFRLNLIEPYWVSVWSVL